MSIQNTRLHFIDIARGIAILMMLQGHFISLSFDSYHSLASEVRTLGSSGSIFFDTWIRLRGFTAPLFFTITGTVFLFVLTGETEGSFWQRKRVKKGIRRGIHLIILGYLLQLNFRNIDLYFSGHINERFFAFHVLNSIGLGIIFLTLLYGLVHKLKKTSLLLVFIATTFVFLLLRPVIEFYSHPYFPSNTFPALQNLFRGPNSVFPLFPWYGFLSAGGAFGILIRLNMDKLHTLKYRLFHFKGTLIVISSFIFIFYLLGLIFQQVDFSKVMYWAFQLMLIGMLLLTLLWLETKYQFKGSLFATVGRNTLVIYFVHAVVLYGAITGFGLKTWIKSSLGVSGSLIGVTIFLAAFISLTYVQPTLQLWWDTTSTKIRKVFF